MSKFKIIKLPYDKVHENRAREQYNYSIIKPQTTSVGVIPEKIDEYIIKWKSSDEGQKYEWAIKPLFSQYRSITEHSKWLKSQVKKHFNLKRAMELGFKSIWGFYKSFCAELWRLYPISEGETEKQSRYDESLTYCFACKSRWNYFVKKSNPYTEIKQCSNPNCRLYISPVKLLYEIKKDKEGEEIKIPRKNPWILDRALSLKGRASLLPQGSLKKRKRFFKKWAKEITLPLVYALMSVDEKLVKTCLK